MNFGAAVKQRFLFVYRERFLFFSTSIAIVVAVACAGFIIGVTPREGRIPLQYDVLFGVGRIGPWYDLLWYPAVTLVLAVFNVMVATWLYPRDKYLAYYCTIMSAIVGILVALYVVNLWIAYL